MSDPSDRSGPEVAAAGGVVLRISSKGRLQVLIIHRPSYDDWSIPKGKLDPGESFEDAAAREVLEETGVRAMLGSELQPVHYADRRGRPKLVRYWLMRPVVGTTLESSPAREPDREVDQVRWVSLAKARNVLTYGHDRDLVDQALEALL